MAIIIKDLAKIKKLFFTLKKIIQRTNEEKEMEDTIIHHIYTVNILFSFGFFWLKKQFFFEFPEQQCYISKKTSVFENCA